MVTLNCLFKKAIGNCLCAEVGLDAWLVDSKSLLSKSVCPKRNPVVSCLEGDKLGRRLSFYHSLRRVPLNSPVFSLSLLSPGPGLTQPDSSKQMS